VHRRSAEIGYWVAEPYWGRGIATKAVGALTAFAFAHHDLVRIFAGVFASNPASARVLEKAGYAFEGRLRRSVVKDGIVLDQLMYAMVRD
jgi:RimJ/RimL family protein N-acetyltransferase